MAGVAKARFATQATAGRHDLLEVAAADETPTRKSSHPIIGIIKGSGSLESNPQIIPSAKSAVREFVDPRLERLHFLQAVQRMRAQIAEQDTADDAIARADLMSGRPQRPQSAAARLHISGQSQNCPNRMAAKEVPLTRTRNIEESDVQATVEKSSCVSGLVPSHGVRPACSVSWE
jgi:hypothetical protein